MIYRHYASTVPLIHRSKCYCQVVELKKKKISPQRKQYTIELTDRGHVYSLYCDQPSEL